MAFNWVKETLLGYVTNSLPDLIPDMAFKNLPFEPGNRKLWLKLMYVPVTEEAETLGIHGDNGYHGYLQIGVYQRINEGTDLAEATLNRLDSLLAIPQRIAAPPGCMLRLERKMSGQGGQTSEADMATGGTETVWDANYLTIFWLAREPR